MRNDYSSTSADRQSDAAGSLTKFILERHSKHQQQLRAFGISISAGCEVPKQNLKHQRLLKIIICMKCMTMHRRPAMQRRWSHRLGQRRFYSDSDSILIRVTFPQQVHRVPSWTFEVQLEDFVDLLGKLQQSVDTFSLVIN